MNMEHLAISFSSKDNIITMNKISRMIPLVFSLSSALCQSPCPINGISTNPQNPSPQNAGFKTNIFNWMNSSFSASNNANYGTNSPLTNFFNYPNPFYSSFILGQASDYHPADGWELIKRDF